MPAGRPITVDSLKQRADQRVGHSRTRRPAGPCEAASSSESTIAVPSTHRGRGVREPLGPTTPDHRPTNRAIAGPVVQHRASKPGPVATSAGFGGRKPAGASTSGGAAAAATAARWRAATAVRVGDPQDDGGRRHHTPPPSRCSEPAPPCAATRRWRICDPARVPGSV